MEKKEKIFKVLPKNFFYKILNILNKVDILYMHYLNMSIYDSKNYLLKKNYQK